MLGVPKRKINVTTLYGIAVRNFFTVYVFARPDPYRWETPQIRGFEAPWAQDGHWHSDDSQARAENGNGHSFPVLGALSGGESGRPKRFFPKVRNFLAFSVLADQTPRGEKSQSTGILGHFGLGRPSVLR